MLYLEWEVEQYKKKLRGLVQNKVFAFFSSENSDMLKPAIHWPKKF